MICVLNVESAAVEIQYRVDIVNDNRVASLMTGGRSGGTAVVSPINAFHNGIHGAFFVKNFIL